MLGAALLAAVPTKWARFVAFGMLAGLSITALSVGVFYGRASR